MTLRGAMTVVTVASAGLAAVVAFAYGVRDGLISLALLMGPGLAALLVAGVAARRRSRLGPLRRQLGLAAAIAVGQLVVVTAAGAALMFLSSHDAVLALVIVALAAIVAVCVSRLLATDVIADVHALRDALVAVGDGAREPAPLPAGRDELAELTVAANATIARLADAERARRDLIAAVSHDLRTPLTSLRLLAAAVEDGVVTGEDRTIYLARMGAHVEALSALIDDLFELSRLEAGDVHWGLERVRLDELVGHTVAAMQVEADARMVQVSAQIGDGEPAAHGNPERLRRVLFNLIQNAIRHTPADGSVTVSAQTTAEEVEIEVADTGPGIPCGERGRVFEAGFRGGEDPARTTDGAGLGLAISRAIVEAHGGRIWLADAPIGTRVRFALPRTT